MITALKAALWSSKISIGNFPEPEFSKISHVMFNDALCVLCRDQNLD